MKSPKQLLIRPMPKYTAIRYGTKTMPVFKDNIILMRVSVPENEIVCYTVDNAISNAKVRMQM